jgi:hypothetical protein
VIGALSNRRSPFDHQLCDFFSVERGASMSLDEQRCQSCGAILRSDSDCGTNTDRTLNHEYCHYCFLDGTYQDDCSLDTMLSIAEQVIGDVERLPAGEAAARARRIVPQLARWQELRRASA